MAKTISISPVLDLLGFDPDRRLAIFHADDIGMCHGANVAFEELSRLGTINCGSVMVPCPWFTEAANMAAANPELDLGVHLTLISEWETYRWAPISTTSRSSGLLDEDGYFWRKLPALAANVIPEAAEEEMRSQIERAFAAGIDITHLDTHMGAAVLPELVEIYIRMGREYKLPVLLPRRFSEYTSMLDFGDVPLVRYEELLAKLEAKEWPLVDHFRMTPGVASADCERVYRDLIVGLQPGLNLIALHPNTSGDIETIVPPRAHFRTDEYRLLNDPEFRNLVSQQDIRTIGFRPLRKLMRSKEKI